MDVFRIFDPLNWTENMRVAMDAVHQHGGICEAAICYTGDILNPQRPKYNLKYYVELAKELEKMGAHILAIKDMAGLCKPYAAELLVKTLKRKSAFRSIFTRTIPAACAAASVLKAAEVGVDIADAALAPMSGLTSQPNLNAIVEALHSTPRDTGLDSEHLRLLAHYWQAVREFYTPFESGMKAPDADLYLHEMPGGQFTNLLEQARALGLSHRWDEVCRMYADVNQLLGDIVKVTPTSKAVGDLALFLVTNNLTAEDVLDPTRDLAFPESVIDLLAGRMGQPPGGFPPEVQKRILRNVKPVKGRPGESLPPADFAAAAATVEKLVGRKPNEQEVVSYLLYPRVFQDFVTHVAQFSDISMLPTPFFLYGQQPGEELTIDIEPGKTLIVKLLTVGEPHPDGTRTVFFELNGQPRSVSVLDKSVQGGRCSPPESESDRSEANCRADAGAGRHRADQSRRQREERAKTAVAGSDENGNDALCRQRRQHCRSVW